MPKIVYVDKSFRATSLEIIQQANDILADYARQGFDLTLRQLYYQFVARDILPNTQQSYKRVGSIVNDARLAGLIDWDCIVDRTRSLRGLSHWDRPENIIDSAAAGYRVDKWQTQEWYIEAWIEKDALVGVLESVCDKWDMPYFSCRGYTSQSEMWSAARRIRQRAHKRNARILHLGDHDPSGIDMSRDIADRLALFGAVVDVRRIALNMEQVQAYGPPPNPAKITDSRAAGYMAIHGEESWELDALNPQTITKLIDGEVDAVLDRDKWQERVDYEQEGRDLLNECSSRWGEVVEML